MRGLFHETGRVLALLRNIERESPSQDEAGEMKLAILTSEAETLIKNHGWTSLQALSLMRELNGSSKPRLPDTSLTGWVAGLMQRTLASYGREGELAKGSEDLFAHAEREVETQRGIEPVQIHVPVLDGALMSGFYPGHIFGIVGHEGSLKSSLALHVAEKNTWENPQVRCLFCSLDMTLEMLTFRRVSRYLGMHEVSVRSMAELGDRGYTKARDEIKRLDDGRMFFLPAPLTLEDLRKNMEVSLPNLVIIDYISLLSVPDA